MSLNCRFLHFVLKIGDFKQNIEFFRDTLRMTVLRHEVFDEGCDAACNGPYDNKWSKTMIGYGPESDNFVLELTYNYTVGSYKLGNDFQYIKLNLSANTYNSIGFKLTGCKPDSNQMTLKSPDGYTFVMARDMDTARDEITEVCLSSSNVEHSTRFWRNVMQMNGVSQTETESLQRYMSPSRQTGLRFKKVEDLINHATAYGRMAFSIPTCELEKIQALKGVQVLKPLVKLETPGKADVEVVIIADPDGHEVCYVGEEGFSELAQVDPKANELAEKSIAEDKSREWFERKGKTKREA